MALFFLDTPIQLFGETRNMLYEDEDVRDANKSSFVDHD